MRFHSKIFLLGFMGSGKSYAGQLLAKKLDYNFIDLDNYIEKKHKGSITSIFKLYGETYFRKTEKTALEEICKTTGKTIIALGGGTPCFYNNMELINKNGTSVFIERPIDILVKNLSKSNNRPLIQGFTKEKLEEFVEKKLLERKKHYKKAQKSVNFQEEIDLEKLIIQIQLEE